MTRKMLFSLPGNDAGAEDHGVAGIDVGMFVVVHGGAAERPALMGSPWVPLMSTINCSGGKSRDLAGIDDQAPAAGSGSPGPAQSQCFPSWNGPRRPLCVRANGPIHGDADAIDGG